MGFGDVAPTTNVERMMAMLIILAGGVAQASIFGNIAVLLRGFDRVEGGLRLRLARLRDLARVHALPADMAERMAQSAALQWSQARHPPTPPRLPSPPFFRPAPPRRSAPERPSSRRRRHRRCAFRPQVQGKDYQTALAGLSDGLVAEVLASMPCTRVVSEVPLFAGFPPGFVAKIVARLRLQTYLRGELVIDEARGQKGVRLVVLPA